MDTKGTRRHKVPVKHRPHRDPVKDTEKTALKKSGTESGKEHSGDTRTSKGGSSKWTGGGFGHGHTASEKMGDADAKAEDKKKGVASLISKFQSHQSKPDRVQAKTSPERKGREQEANVPAASKQETSELDKSPVVSKISKLTQLLPSSEKRTKQDDTVTKKHQKKAHPQPPRSPPMTIPTSPRAKKKSPRLPTFHGAQSPRSEIPMRSKSTLSELNGNGKTVAHGTRLPISPRTRKSKKTGAGASQRAADASTARTNVDSEDKSQQEKRVKRNISREQRNEAMRFLGSPRATRKEDLCVESLSVKPSVAAIESVSVSTKIRGYVSNEPSTTSGNSECSRRTTASKARIDSLLSRYEESMQSSRAVPCTADTAPSDRPPEITAKFQPQPHLMSTLSDLHNEPSLASQDVSPKEIQLDPHESPSLCGLNLGVCDNKFAEAKDLSFAEMSQKERIAKYKEDRRKQLAYISSKCDVKLKCHTSVSPQEVLVETENGEVTKEQNSSPEPGGFSSSRHKRGVSKEPGPVIRWQLDTRNNGMDNKGNNTPTNANTVASSLPLSMHSKGSRAPLENKEHCKSSASQTQELSEERANFPVKQLCEDTYMIGKSSDLSPSPKHKHASRKPGDKQKKPNGDAYKVHVLRPQLSPRSQKRTAGTGGPDPFQNANTSGAVLTTHEVAIDCQSDSVDHKCFNVTYQSLKTAVTNIQRNSLNISKGNPRSIVSNSPLSKVPQRVAFGTTVPPTTSKATAEGGEESGTVSKLSILKSQCSPGLNDVSTLAKTHPTELSLKERNVEQEQPQRQTLSVHHYRHHGPRSLSQAAKQTQKLRAQTPDSQGTKSGLEATPALISEKPHGASGHENRSRQPETEHTTSVVRKTVNPGNAAERAPRETNRHQSADVKLSPTKRSPRVGTAKSDITTNDGIKKAPSMVQSVASKSSSTEMKQGGLSFTSKFRTSPRYSWGFGGKMEIKRKSPGAGPTPSQHVSRHRMKDSCGETEEVKPKIISNTVTESPKEPVKDEGEPCSKVLVSSNVPLHYSAHAKRPSLPLHLERFRQGNTSEKLNEIQGRPFSGASKRCSFSEGFSRAERLEKLKKEEQEAVARFQKFMYRNKTKTAYSSVSEVSEIFTEEAREVQRCFIRVSSVEEARDVANSLLDRAGRDFQSKVLEWETAEDKTVTEQEDDEREDNNTLEACEIESTSSGLGTKTAVEETAESSDNTIETVWTLETSESEDRSHPHDQVLKNKRFRSAAASPGETSLVGDRHMGELNQSNEAVEVIPNVRKLDYQPMICIPLQPPETMDEMNGRDDLGGHHVLETIKQRKIVPLQIMPDENIVQENLDNGAEKLKIVSTRPEHETKTKPEIRTQGSERDAQNKPSARQTLPDSNIISKVATESFRIPGPEISRTMSDSSNDSDTGSSYTSSVWSSAHDVAMKKPKTEEENNKSTETTVWTLNRSDVQVPKPVRGTKATEISQEMSEDHSPDGIISTNTKTLDLDAVGITSGSYHKDGRKATGLRSVLRDSEYSTASCDMTETKTLPSECAATIRHQISGYLAGDLESSVGVVGGKSAQSKEMSEQSSTLNAHQSKTHPKPNLLLDPNQQENQQQMQNQQQQEQHADAQSDWKTLKSVSSPDSWKAEKNKADYDALCGNDIHVKKSDGSSHYGNAQVICTAQANNYNADLSSQHLHSDTAAVKVTTAGESQLNQLEETSQKHSDIRGLTQKEGVENRVTLSRNTGDESHIAKNSEVVPDIYDKVITEPSDEERVKEELTGDNTVLTSEQCPPQHPTDEAELYSFAAGDQSQRTKDGDDSALDHSDSSLSHPDQYSMSAPITDEVIAFEMADSKTEMDVRSVEMTYSKPPSYTPESSRGESWDELSVDYVESCQSQSKGDSAVRKVYLLAAKFSGDSEQKQTSNGNAEQKQAFLSPLEKKRGIPIQSSHEERNEGEPETRHGRMLEQGGVEHDFQRNEQSISKRLSESSDSETTTTESKLSDGEEKSRVKSGIAQRMNEYLSSVKHCNMIPTRKTDSASVSSTEPIPALSSEGKTGEFHQSGSVNPLTVETSVTSCHVAAEDKAPCGTIVSSNKTFPSDEASTSKDASTSEDNPSLLDLDVSVRDNATNNKDHSSKLSTEILKPDHLRSDDDSEESHKKITVLTPEPDCLESNPPKGDDILSQTKSSKLTAEADLSEPVRGKTLISNITEGNYGSAEPDEISYATTPEDNTSCDVLAAISALGTPSEINISGRRETSIPTETPQESCISQASPSTAQTPAETPAAQSRNLAQDQLFQLSAPSSKSRIPKPVGSLDDLPVPSVEELKLVAAHDVGVLYSRMDLSADSFNSLFLQNAIYLEDASSEDQDKDAKHISTVASKRKRSRGRSSGKRQAKRSSLQRSGESKEGTEDKQNNRSSPESSLSRDHASQSPPRSVTTKSEQNRSAKPENGNHPGKERTSRPRDNQPSPYTSSDSPLFASDVSESPSATSPTLCLSDISQSFSVTQGEDDLGNTNNSNKTLTLIENQRLDQCVLGESTEKEDFEPKGASSRSVKKGHKDKEDVDAQRDQGSLVEEVPTNEDSEFDEEGENEEDMDARRRRRLLERSSHVSTELPSTASSWRSKVYETENGTSSSSYSSKEYRHSYRSKDAVITQEKEVHKNDVESTSETRRRRSEDTNNSDLAERLAKRRQRRLEEQGESSSLDGSFDSPRQRERGWSRDGSVRSVDSAENGEVEERLLSRRQRRQESEVVSSQDGGYDGWKSSRRSSRDSVMSVDSTTDHVEESERGTTRRWSRRRDSENSNTGEPELTSLAETTDFRARKWSSKDSSFKSADSTSSFRSCEDGENKEGDRHAPGSHRRTSLENDHNEDTDNTVSERRRRRRFQDLSGDSAFSESKEKSEDASNNNNNSNANNSKSVSLPQESLAASFASRRRRMQDYIDECEEMAESSPDASTSAVNGFHDDKSDEKEAGSSAGESQASSRWRSHVPLTSSASVDTGLAKSPKSHVSGDANVNGVTKQEATGGDGAESVAESFQARLQRMRGAVSEDVSPTYEKPKGKPNPDNAPETKGIEPPTTTEGVPGVKGTKTSKTVQDSEEKDKFSTPPSSPGPDGGSKRRKTRKEKSTARRSAHNVPDEDSSNDEETREDNSQLGSDGGQQDGRSRRRGEGSFVSQHASFWEKHAPNTQHAPPSRQRTNIPTRYMGDLSAKIKATRQKFSKNEAETADSSVTTAAASGKPKADTSEDGAPKEVARGRTDFSQLLQKFSGSESASSDADGLSTTASGIPKRRSLVRRQEAKEVISSSEESDASRRTPERTQSLKLVSRRGDGLASGDGSGSKTGSGLEKSSSFRSEFMSRRMAQRNTDTDSSQQKDSSISPRVTPTAAVKTTGDAGKDSKLNEKKDMGSLNQSLELLSRVTEELDHPERPSSLQTTPPDLKSPSKRDSWTAISEAENVIKEVESSITSMASRKSPDKAKSPSPGSIAFTFKHNNVPSGDKSTPAPATSPSQAEQKHIGHSATSTYTSEAARRLEDTSLHSKSSSVESRSSAERLVPPANSPSSSPAPSPSRDFPSSSVSSIPTSLSSSDIHSASAASQQSSDASGVRRTSSFKDVSVSRTDSLERRKGILKRTTSLTKQDSPDSSSFPIVDPQLAKILQQRKQMVGDLDEKEEDEGKDDLPELVRRRSRALSAAEEIEETLKYSQQKAAERGINPEEDEGLKRTSVADRVYHMQTKIEEEKYSAVTSRSRSGISTPKSRPRSGFITPTQQKSLEESLQQQQHASTTSASSSSTTATISHNDKASNSAGEHQSEPHQSDPTTLSGPQLMEKLTKIADANVAYQEKRQRFQHRNRNDWRHQTQPVTYEEIRAADSLETVSHFRALIRKKTSINAFDQLKVQTTSTTRQQLSVGVAKKSEFPQHLAPPPKQRRSRRLRHRTLPVTAEELNAVPENQILVTEPEWAKCEDAEKRDSKADSGILSGSDADSLYEQSSQHSVETLRHLTLEMDLWENDPSRLSVTDKASMFRVLEEKTKAERDREKSASGAKRYIIRKKRERSQTMPITEDEVKNAAEMGDGRSGTASNASKVTPSNLPQPEVVNRPRSNSNAGEEGEKETSDDELTKLSLSEKVKLFSQLKEKDKQPAKVEAPVVRRRNRKQASRFSTQPVTSEEVEKAAAFSRISPLAMSMVKPPDPEMLKTLPLKDQRELMAQHAEMFLSQSSLRSQGSRSGSTASLSQPSSRRASVTTEDGENKKAAEETEEGILKDKSASTKELNDVKGILKTEPSKAKSEPEVHSILKTHTETRHHESVTVSASEPRGILKKTRSEDMAAGDSGDEIKGILKHTDSEEEEHAGKPRSRSNSQPLGILKRDTSPGPGDQPLEIKGILKAPSQENVHEPMKSALRRGSMDSDSSTSSSGVLKSALKNRSKNNSESEEGQTDTTSEHRNALHRSGKEHTPDPDLNVNNSNRHVDLTIKVAQVEEDHLMSSVTTKEFSRSSREEITVTSKEVVETSRTSSHVSVTSSSSTLKVPEDSDARSGQSASEEGESSSGEILEDAPKGTRLKRKSRFSSRTAKDERYKTQPPELTGDSSSSTSKSTEAGARRKIKYNEGRHRTQPITPDEMREATESAAPETNLNRVPGGSIADRLSQLKTSGEEGWRRRVEKKDDIIATPDVVVKLREKSGMPAQRPSSIADRLNELDTSKTTWKKRVEESDAKQFTVAGKLANNATESPLVNKLKNMPRKDEPGSKGSTPLSSPVTPTKEFIAKIPLPKDIVQDTSVKIEPAPAVKKPGGGGGTGGGDEEKKEPVKVQVPDMGEELESFFAIKSIEEIKDKVEMEIDDFNDIFIEAEMILPSLRKARPARKTKASSHNPLKTMSQKVEIQQEYTEIIYGTAEKELKRKKKEDLASNAGFAQAALAGLASMENFKQVELRRSDSGSSPHGQRLDPFNDLMLLHVKGRRTVQTRLVEPNTRSLNEGDCYILVTPDKVIHWEGQFANVIEKAKASEVASYIQQKKDLGCKKANEVFTVYQAKDHLGPGKLLWSSLEGEKQCQVCGPDAEDELYESSMTRSNMVYRLEGNALLPYEEYWGAIPRHEMLKKNEVIVFDFGTEFYVWQGKAVSMEQRKLGLRLAKQLYEKGYDYSESAINPLSPLRTEEDGGLSVKAAQRPKWAIFGKVNQNMETILFREKFSDWPDSSRLIGCKGHGPAEGGSKEKDVIELKPFDAAKMIPPNTSPVTLKLEGAHVGRGTKWAEDMQGFIKEQEVVTLGVTVWHVMEYDHYKLEEASHGQFHDGDTYVVRWQYMIANANLRSLKGSATRNSLAGRERCAYFFWQGNQSTINEKGASALMTVELDEERGPQVRVLEGKEPPCFLNLFKGKMVVHIGKREDPSTNTQGAWRLYCLRGDYENEVYLLEIPVCIDHLRSRSSLILLNVKTGLVYIWHGTKSPSHVRQLCRTVVDRFKENTPLELGLHEKASMTVTEVEEGEEKKEIWSALDSSDRKIYNSLLTDPKPYKHTVRLFHMSSVNMIFEVHEQLSPMRVPDLTTPFPFLQADLYKSTQPALFLLDNHHEVYLWQGWWPVGSHDTENVHTGSATARFNMDRRCAMETTLHYCKEKNPSNPPKAYLVCAGLEPVCFTSLFPYWMVDTIVKDIAIEEGRTEGYIEKVSDILHRLTQTRYTLAELQERPLPEGVDPLKLESYLDDAEFEEILDMNREEFYAQPSWKQRDMKKHVGLF